VIVLTILILTAAARAPKLRAALLALCGVALLFGGGVAVFHVGVEQHWWTGTPGCGVPATANSIDALRAQIMAAPVVRCDQVAWSLFGISMAGYNILISLALAAIAFMSARRAIGSAQ
jgi:disulfide bond formation protein DsbB